MIGIAVLIFIGLVTLRIEVRRAVLYTGLLMFLYLILLSNFYPGALDTLAMYFVLLLFFFAAIGLYFSLRFLSE